MISRVHRFSRLVTAIVLACLLFAGLAIQPAVEAADPSTTLISTPFRVPNTNFLVQGGSSPSLSGDGSSVAYTANGRIFLRDKRLQTAEAVSIAVDTNQLSDGISSTAMVNRDGNIVAFESTGTNLVTSPSGSRSNIYVRNRGASSTELISVPLDSSQPPDGDSFFPAVSSDGNLVAFTSTANNLVNETIGRAIPVSQIFVRDRGANSTKIVSLRTGNTPFPVSCFTPSISDDGRVVFESNGSIFLAQNGSVTQISMTDTEPAYYPVISANGSVIAYQSASRRSIVMIDSGSMTEIIVSNIDDSRSDHSLVGPSINADGSIIAFASTFDNENANNLGVLTTFTFNRLTGRFNTVSVSDAGIQSANTSGLPSIDASGQFVAFASADTLTGDDRNLGVDVFLRDRGDVNADNGGGGLGGDGGGVGGVNLNPVCIVRGSAASSRQVDITWGSGAHNDSLGGFTVEITRRDGDKFRTMAKLPADTLDVYHDTDVQPKTRYDYRVWVKDPHGFSYTTDFSVKTKKEPKKK